MLFQAGLRQWPEREPHLKRYNSGDFGMEWAKEFEEPQHRVSYGMLGFGITASFSCFRENTISSSTTGLGSCQRVSWLTIQRFLRYFWLQTVKSKLWSHILEYRKYLVRASFCTQLI